MLSVGADAHIAPPYRTPGKKLCHCEPVTDVTGVAIRTLGPLPKGGWHGEAVTGGYLTSPHLL